MEDNIPEEIVDGIIDNTRCYVMFYFNKEGKPYLLENTNSVEQKMALLYFLLKYLDNTQLSEGKNELPPEEGGDSDGSDYWKK